MLTNRWAPFFLVGLVVALVLTGTFGYMIIEGWSFHDALYMTIITLTTTGYQEVHALSRDGRTFTIVILIFGMGTVAVSATTVLNYIATFDFRARGRKRMEKRIAKLQDHAVIFGFGRMGQVIARELTSAKVDFVVVDRRKELLGDDKVAGLNFIVGDATNDDVLEKAGVDRAKVLVSMVDDDADNLYLALAGRTMNPKAYIIARANEERAQSKIIRAGADRVVLPVLTSGLKVAQYVLNPAVDDLLNITGVNLDASNRIQVSEVKIDRESPYAGKELRDIGVKLFEVLVIGVRKPSHEFMFAPKASYRFEVGDTMITLSTAEAFNQLERSPEV